MSTLIFVLHIISCLFLIGLILLQKGQGADMGAAFGGASNTVFGSRGPATFFNKLTIAVAVIFLSASLYLANVEKKRETNTVVDKTTEKIEKEIADGAPAIGGEEAPEKEVLEGEQKAIKEGEKKVKNVTKPKETKTKEETNKNDTNN